MGLVYADVELTNAADIIKASSYVIGEEEIKRMHLNILVDSGALMLAINENIQEYLQVPFVEKRKAQLADSTIKEYDVVGPIELRFQNRKVLCSAMVMEGDSEPLLGVIPMEEMDVLIHPTRNELIVNPEHPLTAQLKLK
jgi:clan AA aspartic protease